jgi:NADH-quinone oxidoreductase subunit D
MPITAERLDPETEILTINMGPQHPATHGVLRMVLKLDGETIVDCVPHVGYLHRGMGKIAEHKTYHQFIPYTDRMDYLAPFANNIGYTMAVEKLMGIADQIPRRAQYLRTICCELARISSHYLWLGCHGLDLGALTVFFYTFQEREVLYDIIESICGARFTTSYSRIGGLARDFSPEVIQRIRQFLPRVERVLGDVEGLLTHNRIWMERNQGVGVISAKDAVNLSLSGPNLRASGVRWDIRKARPYNGYDEFDFDVPVGTKGDAYDRYLVRLEEMHQSVRIITQALDGLPEGEVGVNDHKIFLPRKKRVLTKMEELIHLFMVITDGIKPTGECYFSIENPKGEYGYYLVGDGEVQPYRLHVRSPSFMSLQALPHLVRGRMIADAVACIASIDPVMGDCDR